MDGKPYARNIHTAFFDIKQVSVKACLGHIQTNQRLIMSRLVPANLAESGTKFGMGTLNGQNAASHYSQQGVTGSLNECFLKQNTVPIAMDVGYVHPPKLRVQPPRPRSARLIGHVFLSDVPSGSLLY